MSAVTEPRADGPVPFTVVILRVILGAVYTAMAAGQVASWTAMPDILAGYHLLGGAALPVLAALLIAGELACGVWFLARPRSMALAPVWIYTGVSVVWAALGVQAYARGLSVDNCGCFGVYLTQRLSWVVLVEDALLLVYAVLLVRSVRRISGRADLTGHRLRSRSASAIARWKVG